MNMTIVKRLILGVAWIWICSGCSEERSKENFETQVSQVHAPGYVEPEGRMRRLSFADSGVIGILKVDVGDMIQKGEILAQLESAVEEARVEESRAALSRAEAKLALLQAGAHPQRIKALRAEVEEARADYQYREDEAERLESLFAEDGISLKEMDLARHEVLLASARLEKCRARLEEALNMVRSEDLAVAQADVTAEKVALKLAEEQLERRALRAPSAGRVLEVFLREGERTENGPMILFAPEGPLMVRAEVDEGFVGLVRPGQRASVMMPGSDGANVQGVVSKVKPVMGEKRVFTREAHERLDIQVFEVFVELPDSEVNKWQFGMEVEVVIEIGGAS
ncbi:efflux RND transporter periplasmic adaptor subunit [Akkermansiaceae bacterium]|nr:efflux RND transporter periplasmic adaptor subunit [Akkermansiaceae bacterium]